MYEYLLVLCNCRIIQQLEKEARMSVLKHVNIVALHAIILEPGHYGIVMEYVRHGALDEFILTYVVWCSVFVYRTFVSCIALVITGRTALCASPAGANAQSAYLRYCFTRGSVFRFAQATHCTDQGEIWKGVVDLPNFTLISSGVWIYLFELWNFGSFTNIIAPKGWVLCTILTKFTRFMRFLSLHNSALSRVWNRFEICL